MLQNTIFEQTLKKTLKKNLKELYWKLYYQKISNPEPPKVANSFLFVCKGNICRSPFAEYCARNIAENSRIAGNSFFSAGLQVLTSNPPPNEAVKAAECFEIILSDHKSKPLSSVLLESISMIITMEAKQMVTLKNQYPQIVDRLYLLPLFEYNIQDEKSYYNRLNINDPYGKSTNEFIICYRRIEACLRGLFTKLYGNIHLK